MMSTHTMLSSPPRRTGPGNKEANANQEDNQEGEKDSVDREKDRWKPEVGYKHDSDFLCDE